ncbi:carbohydrate deacetylase [Photobacterium kishitanii]|uniref:Carbohydrate deacetylase n=1 Tax=Photobacterium kishitanii TaxID=318456 RepID=A0A2T3KIN6_9GAMM|nr:carbohydrate deacetylase [Photobacterium kishitanii]PSU99178.1 carbohydrate deacetylase [Photobacterium kishitanii]
MKLIMNADDFGLTPKVNDAIIQCLQAGIVKSTTLMINQAAVSDAIVRINAGDVIGDVGLHITLTAGKPILASEFVTSLIDSDGYFLKKPQLFSRTDVDAKQAYQEMHAQYQRALDLGFNPSHIDSHHFAAALPQLKCAFVQFLNDIGLPARRVDVFDAGLGGLTVPTTDAFDMKFFDQGVSEDKLKQLILKYQKMIPNGVLELMCHPGLQQDSLLTSVSGYVDLRYQELLILTDPQLRLWLQKQDIQCVNFSDLI